MAALCWELAITGKAVTYYKEWMGRRRSASTLTINMSLITRNNEFTAVPISPSQA
jgi:hypothetical protein